MKKLPYFLFLGALIAFLLGFDLLWPGAGSSDENFSGIQPGAAAAAAGGRPSGASAGLSGAGGRQAAPSFSSEMEVLVQGIAANQIVRVRVGEKERRYLFRPKRITADNFQISIDPETRWDAAFAVYEGQEILADGRLGGSAKLAIVNDTLSLAYANGQGDFLIEEVADGRLVARTLLSRAEGSTWGHFQCREVAGRPGIVDASGDSPMPPVEEAEISLEGATADEPEKEGARADHSYFRLGPEYDASLKDILILMVSSKSQTGTNLSSKAATYFTYAATTADVYERQLGLRYQLQELVLIPSNSTQDDIEPAVNNPSDSGSDDLQALRSWLNTHRPQAVYQWGHAMGWTLVDGSSGGMIGWAYTGSYGSSTFGISVNEPAWTWGVHVHELGHSVGANHTTGAGGAMNPSVSRSNPQEDFFRQSETGAFTAAKQIYDYMSAPIRSFVTGPAPLRNPNEMPLAVDDVVATPANTPVTFNPMANDLAATPLFGQTNTELRLVEIGQIFPKAAGAVTLSNGEITFTPTAGFSGNVWFTYTLGGNLGRSGKGWFHAADVIVTVGGSATNPAQNPTISTTDDRVVSDFTGTIRFNPLLNDEATGRLGAGPVEAVNFYGPSITTLDGTFRLIGATVVTGNGTITFETADITRNGVNTQQNTGYLIYTPGIDDPAMVEIEYTVEDASGNQSTGRMFIRAVDPREVKLSGTIIGTSGSYNNNPAWNKDKVFDGSLSTYYDAANASGDWVGLDLGAARPITSLAFAPRTSWATRMVGGKFEGSSTPDFSSGVVTLYTVPTTPQTGVLTRVAVQESTPFRYVRYIGPNNGFCNVAEVEFYTEGAPAPPSGLTAGVDPNGHINLNWSENEESDLVGYRIYRSTTPDNFPNPPTATTTPEFTDTNVANNTTYYYVVTAMDADEYESDWSNQATATSSVNAFVPTVHAGQNRTAILSGETAWTPAQLPSVVGWYDAADANTITQSGGAVSMWSDKSSQNVPLAQNNLNQQPRTDAPTINGLPVIKFDGSDDTLVTGINPFAPSIADAMVIAVHRVDTTANGTLFNISGTSNSPGRWQAHAPHNSNLFFDAGATNGGARISGNYGVVAGDVVLVSFYSSTTESTQEMYKNGAFFRGDSTGQSTPTVGNISVGSGAGTQYQNTSIGEILFLNGTVTLENRQNIEGYLAHKWGLASSLPVDHPHKLMAPGGNGITIQLSGSASDDDGSTPTVLWTLQSGASPVIFSNPSALDSLVTFSEPGTYILRLTADDGAYQSFDEVTITVSLEADSDGNGIDDSWEIEFFGEVGIIDGSADSDQDGVRDFFEYLYGTDPTDSASNGFRVTAGTSANNSDITFRWEVRENFSLGTEYDVRISTNLVTWEPLPPTHYTFQETTENGRTSAELTITYDYGDKLFLRLIKP